jgi:hypothetical protein
VFKDAPETNPIFHRILVVLYYNWLVLSLLLIVYFMVYGIGIAAGYRPDDRGIGVRVPVGSRILSTSSRPPLGPTQPPIQWVPGALSPGMKRPGREADHSPPTSAEVKKT